MSSEPVILEQVRRDGWRNITVPYRQNRAVIFDSALFHKSGRIAFKLGYTNRRINLTLLFGKKGDVCIQPDEPDAA